MAAQEKSDGPCPAAASGRASILPKKEGTRIPKKVETFQMREAVCLDLASLPKLAKRTSRYKKSQPGVVTCEKFVVKIGIN